MDQKPNWYPTDGTATYSALVQDVSAAPRSYVDAERLACQMAARLVTAWKK